MRETGFLFRLFRGLVFFAGDVRRLSSFPWVTWAAIEHKITLDEVLRDAIALLRPGDIILHRDAGYLSNLFIGGAMIHAGIYVGDGYVVEAISEGVMKRHAAYILHSDYACILRPRITEEPDSAIQQKAVKQAVEMAEKIVGFPYDYLFEFCGDEDRALIKLYGKKAEEYGVKFACTEIPYFCYLDYLMSLQVHRRRNINLITRLISWLGLHPGKAVVDADMYIRANFDIVWCSKTFTPQWAKRMGCDEKYVAKLSKWWSDKCQSTQSV